MMCIPEDFLVQLVCVDTHTSILLRIKKNTRNPKESSYCPEATVGLNRGQLVVHRTASEEEAQASSTSNLQLKLIVIKEHNSA
jgi:hypothetical protein